MSCDPCSAIPLEPGCIAMSANCQQLPGPVRNVPADGIPFSFLNNCAGAALPVVSNVADALLAVEASLCVVNPAAIRSAPDCSWLKIQKGQIVPASPMQVIQCLPSGEPNDTLLFNGCSWIIGQLSTPPILDPPVPYIPTCADILPLIKSCPPVATDVPTSILSFNAAGDLAYRPMPTAASSTTPPPLVSGVNGAISEQKVEEVEGYDSTGALIRTARRPLVRAMWSGQAAGTSITGLVGTLATPANRIISLWVPTVTGQQLQQQPVDFSYDGAGKFSAGHPGWYALTANTFIRLRMALSEDKIGSGWAVLSAFVIDNTAAGGSIYEQRFGEDTITADSSDINNANLVGSGYDVVHSGSLSPIFLGTGGKVWVRSWVSGSNATSDAATVTFTSFNAPSVFGVAELPPNAF